MRNEDEVDRGSQAEEPKATLYGAFASDEDVQHERDLLNDVGGDGGGVIGAMDDGRALEQPGFPGWRAREGRS